MAITETPTTVISGPVAHRATLLRNLTQGGYKVAEGDIEHGHGLPAAETVREGADGNRYGVGVDDPSVGFITVETDDLEALDQFITHFQWRIRAHWVTPPMDTASDFASNMVTEDRVKELIEQALGEK